MSTMTETLTPKQVAQYIDHTKLMFASDEDTPDKQNQAITRLCEEAKQYQFAAVCIRPEFVTLAKQVLVGSNVLVATVIGFPKNKVTLEQEHAHPTVGNVPLNDKMAETLKTVSQGCDEFDLVMNIPQFKQDQREQTQKTLDEFRQIHSACGGKGLKIIIETDLLSPDEIKLASRWCAEAGAAMVKTSTGMVDGGAGGTTIAVNLIQQALADYQKTMLTPQAVSIKASGGIKTLRQAHELITLGVSRLGTSSGVSLVQEAGKQK